VRNVDFSTGVIKLFPFIESLPILNPPAFVIDIGFGSHKVTPIKIFAA